MRFAKPFFCWAVRQDQADKLREGKGTNVKKIAIMQPYFFPYLGYWQLIGAVDVYVVFDDVNYIKRGWINRNKIRLSSGEVSYIRLPITKASQNKLICEHTISNLDESKSVLFKTMEYNYKKRPHYYDGMGILEKLFHVSESNLSDFLFKQIQIVSDYFCFDTEIVRSSELKNNKELLAQEKIIDIVKLLNGEQYINAIGGVSLYDHKRFAEWQIDLKFLNPFLPIYDQGFSDFIPSLSILDVVMNCSQDELVSMGGCYELVNANYATNKEVDKHMDY